MQLDAKGINTLRRATLGLFGLLSMGSLMACGYRLRGMVDLPYKVIALLAILRRRCGLIYRELF